MEDLYDSWQLSGYIGVRNGSVTILQDEASWTINWQERKRSIDLQIIIHNNENDPIVVELLVEPKSMENAL